VPLLIDAKKVYVIDSTNIFLLFLGNDMKSKCLDSKKISPFIPKQGPKLNTPVLSDSRKLIDMLCNDEIWFPSEEITHNDWITNLVSSLIMCLSDDVVFQNLASLCKVKVLYQNCII